ncbi:MAG: cell division protein, partial [Rhodospirillaceae bacterium]
LFGGIAGLLLALPTLWTLAHLAHSMDERLLPDIGFGPVHWGVLAAQPVLVALVAMTTAKVTVMRTLERML